MDLINTPISRVSCPNVENPDNLAQGAFTNYVCIFWHFLTTYVPGLHFLCSKLQVFLTTYPPLSANIICESSLTGNSLGTQLVRTRVSNGTGQCNFSGRRDRSFFIVPGQRDNGTSSKSCHGTGRNGIFDRLSRPVPGRPAGQNHLKIWTFLEKITRFPVLECHFPVLEHPFLF